MKKKGYSLRKTNLAVYFLWKLLTNNNIVDLVLTEILKASETIIVTVSKIASITTFAFDTCSTLKQFTTII